MQGSAEFFAPEMRTVPTSGLLPRMTNLSMKSEKLLSIQCNRALDLRDRPGVASVSSRSLK
jgi:hypothetical protein